MKIKFLCAVILSGHFCFNSVAGEAALKCEIVANDAGSVLRGIQAAYDSGAKSVCVPQGFYRFTGGHGYDPHLDFKNLKDFTIDASGATFVFTDVYGDQVFFDGCQRVVFRGATIDHDPVPFSQGKIESISEDRQLIDIRIASGYPSNLDNDQLFSAQPTLCFYDPVTRLLKPNSVDLNVSGFEKIGERLFRFQLLSPLPADFPIGVGDLVAWRGKGGSVVVLSGCSGMTISNVTVRNGTGFCFKEEFGAGDNHYDHLKVTYGVRPVGATEDPLIASDADAFHSRSVRKGPTLENFLFEGMMDDGVAIHGFYAMAIAANGNKVIIDWRGQPYQVGDNLQFMNDVRCVALEAKVVSFQAISDYRRSAEIPKNVAKEFRDPAQGTYYEVTLDRPVSVQLGWLIADVSVNGNGFVVRNGTIRNHRARSFLIKASDGLIENCTVEGSSMPAMVIAPEASGWDEAGFARNLIIRHNTFRRAAIWREDRYPMAGIVSIAAYEAGQYVPLPGGHRNIVFQDNTFEDDDGVQIMVTSTIGVKILDNRFIRPMQEPSTRGTLTGVDPKAVIWMTQCEDVDIRGNVIINPGPYLGKPVEVTDTVHGKGLTDGITVQ